MVEGPALIVNASNSLWKLACRRSNAVVLVAAMLPWAAHAEGGGHAVNSTTHQPLSGARITLHCMGPPGIEGPTEIRRVTHLTNASGEYSFSVTDQAGCSEVLLSGELEGFHFVGAKDAQGVATTVAATLSFMPDAQWLKEGLGPTPFEMKLSASGSPLTTYNLWFTPFLEAKRIAATPDEIAYVRSKYCEPLRSAYQSMGDREKAGIGKLASSYRDAHGKYVNVYTTSYEQVVEPYCGGL